MSSRDREEALDVFRNTNFTFSENGSFAEIFPSIKDIEVVVKRSVNHDIAKLSTEVDCEHYGKNVVEYIDCTNPMCCKGGLSVSNLIQKMVASNQTHLQKDYMPCLGYEGSVKGIGRHHRCTNYFGVRIAIKYKSASTSEST
ncbi:MAG: hypothetical protein JRE40_03580 [Deltaproteobacteria bacterium]|nr:hypothetical protein [Deltaproteobacteria bacterium]